MWPWLAHQQEVFDILRVHAQQGGLCLMLGEPGTGKSVLKQSLLTHDPKRMITPVVNRTLHTYHNTLRILCEAFQIEFAGRDHHCERLLVQQAFSVHRAGKMLVAIIQFIPFQNTSLVSPDPFPVCAGQPGGLLRLSPVSGSLGEHEPDRTNFWRRLKVEFHSIIATGDKSPVKPRWRCIRRPIQHVCLQLLFAQPTRHSALFRVEGDFGHERFVRKHGDRSNDVLGRGRSALRNAKDQVKVRPSRTSENVRLPVAFGIGQQNHFDVRSAFHHAPDEQPHSSEDDDE